MVLFEQLIILFNGQIIISIRNLINLEAFAQSPGITKRVFRYYTTKIDSNSGFANLKNSFIFTHEKLNI